MAPKFDMFRTFGCRVFPYLRDYASHKLAPRSIVFFLAIACNIKLCTYHSPILNGNDATFIWSFISRLHDEFAIKDLGRLVYFLGLEVLYTDSGLFLSQAKYARDILARAGLLDVKPVATPLATAEYFSSHGVPLQDHTMYHSLVGALQYLTITRPNLSYVVNQNTEVDVWLLYFLGGNFVSWSGKKQPTAARSSCESEYRTLANTAAEIIWITHLLRELGVLSPDRPTILCENKSALFFSQNPILNKRSKHIDIDYHFLRELVSSDKLSTRFVPATLQLADIFTKSLPRPSFESFGAKLCVGSPPLLLRRGINDNHYHPI
ncbi:uncharacterized mitochondrial protein AtMg00810-like [Rutidosis leptorrhynchoides]|uniref:uncharacterized mitochondrial protein AtMg00810-like n=1 Tax=Rutidosis leptorrhynchoides TaxID=125765 RepID=UPI003A99EFC9